jgi:glyoxylase-like metal-dependent hydrolase (beta-lactamase superfamily II)
MDIKSFFEADTATFTYVVSDPATKICAVIDPVLNYDMASGKTATTSADEVIAYIKAQKLTVEWILETHVHADHLTAAQYVKQTLGGKIAIGEHVREVLAFWVALFNTAQDTKLDGSQFDHLFKDGEVFSIGTLKAQVIYTPGHTPACVCYHMGDVAMGDVVFVGDTIFMPYVGTARTDFPGASAATLYNSIQKLYALPDSTKLYVCHDYPKEGDEQQCSTTVAEQKRQNILVHQGVSEAEYVKTRNARDVGKAVPRLLLPSLQVNLRAGGFGTPESNGVQYIKIPVDKL